MSSSRRASRGLISAAISSRSRSSIFPSESQVVIFFETSTAESASYEYLAIAASRSAVVEFTVF